MIGFVALGFAYLKIDNDYIRRYPQAISGYTASEQYTKAQEGFDETVDKAIESKQLPKAERANAFHEWLKKDNEGKPIVVAYIEKDPDTKVETAKKVALKQADDVPLLGYQGDILAKQQAPLVDVAGIDTRPIITCFIGIILAIVLNKLTSFYTHTTHEPVKTLRGPARRAMPRTSSRALRWDTSRP